jgi:hypothetical protein
MPRPQHSLTSIERPRCSRCQTRMMLERVSPGPIGFEQRLFECSKCNQVEINVIASDPFASKALGWLAGESGRRIEAVLCSTNKTRGRNARLVVLQ